MSMTEVDYNKLQRVGWGFKLDPNKKDHVIAKRVWDTKADMLEYLADPNSSAVPGLILVVLNDPNTDNNGAYLVKEVIGLNGITSLTERSVIPLATGKLENITLSEDTSKEVAYIENNKLHITDMRSRWETDF